SPIATAGSCVPPVWKLQVGGAGGQWLWPQPAAGQVFVDGQTRPEVAHAVVVVEDHQPARCDPRNREGTGFQRSLIDIGVDVNEGVLRVALADHGKSVGEQSLVHL